VVSDIVNGLLRLQEARQVVSLYPPVTDLFKWDEDGRDAYEVNHGFSFWVGDLSLDRSRTFQASLAERPAVPPGIEGTAVAHRSKLKQHDQGYAKNGSDGDDSEYKRMLRCKIPHSHLTP
jgi:hypothetical protein